MPGGGALTWVGNLLDEITLAIGVMLILFGLAAFRRTRKFIADCRSTEGRVAGYTTEESEEGVYYYTLIRFHGSSGKEHEIRGSTGLQQPPKAGVPVQITYDPAYPTNAWISGTAAPWVVPWFVLILGMAVVVGGFVLRYF
ncbi:MAG: DUF3592 domain-containing protein [Acidobacteriota bacterium]|nr:DUF3592 domain-containing protein [Acidobacteriota bacterium]